MIQTYKLYTDGAYQADMAIAAIGGYLVNQNDDSIFEFSEKIEKPEFYRFHEALALIHGLKKALEHGVEHLECFSDDISFRNLFNKNILSEFSSQTNPFRQEIFDLKEKFKTIHFYHLKRSFNKRADKLAGKILRIHNEEILPNRTRSHFLGQEHKFLRIPSIVCIEDYEQEEDPFSFMMQAHQQVSHYFLFNIFKNDITKDNIDDNNSITIEVHHIHISSFNVVSSLIFSQKIIQKKLISKGLEILVEVLEQFTLTHPDVYHIGLDFKALEQPLQKLEMLFRKRAILPLPNTPLTKKVLSVTSVFDTIVVDSF